MITLLFSLLLAAPSLADCDNLKILNLQNVDFNLDLNPTETFRVQRSGQDECRYFLTVDNGGAPSFTSRRLTHDGGADSLPAQICGDASCASAIKHFPEATSNADVLSGTLASGDTSAATLRYYPRLTAGAYDRFGNYEANFTLRLYRGTVSGSRELVDTESFRLRYRQAKRIDLSLVNSGGAFDAGATSKSLNFGVLSEGKELLFDLVIKTNAGYRVSLTSENRGVMKSGASSIPYTLSLNGGVYSLSSEEVAGQGAGVSTSAGYRLPGRVRIGALGAAGPGTYSDVVTVKVSTTE